MDIKKSMYLFIIAAVLILSGCSKKDKMADFIPTQAPEADAGNTADEPTAVPEETNITPAPTQPVIGQTTAMYVKLDEYGGTLNIRQTPSTDGTKVGFLVNAEKIDVIEIVDGWASFLYNGAVSYVNSDFLTDKRPEYVEKPTATPKPTNTPAPDPQGDSPDI